MKGLIAKSNF